MRAWVLGLVVALVALPAFAGGVRVPGDSVRNGCVKHTLCNGQGTTGPCDAADGTPQYAQLAHYYLHTFHIATTTDATSIACTVYYAPDGDGYDATDRTQLNSTALSTTQRSFQHAGLLGDTWIECGTLSGGTPVLTIQSISCPAAR